MDLFFLLTGLAIGVVVTWLILRLKNNLHSQVSSETYNILDKEKSIAEERLKDLKLANAKLEEDLKHKTFSETDLRDSLIKAQSEVKNLQEKLVSQQDNIKKLQEQMTDQFEHIAQQIMHRNADAFSKTQHERMGLLLNPLKEKIALFEKKVEETYQSQHLESGLLKNEIKQLASLNQQMSEEAKNLTKALKGDNKVQGNWGEVVLERILERSGLKKDEEYILQGSGLRLKNDEGKHFKPDVVVLLPDEKHLIIDAKASLKAYESYVNCEEEDEQKRCLEAHIFSIKNHIKLLSEKYYQQLHGLNSPDFVLMFLPIESSFSAALQPGNGDIFNYGWERKVVIVSPTTLLATLKTVASIWKNEKQNRNALKIAEQSGRLYDKFHAFVTDLEKIGKHIQLSQNSYDEAMKKLSQGSGNLLTRAEKLKNMGINAKKTIKNNLSFDSNYDGEKPQNESDVENKE